MNDKTRGMVLASFVADALALGVHWIYNTHVIDKKWGRIEGYIKPERPTYHPTKDLGEFTHYGDQTMVLLKSVAQCSGFDIEDFAERWRQFFKTYDGYFDDATKETLKNFAAGKGPTESGAGSQDLAGAARIAPLAYCYQKDLDGFITAARAQTALTHNSPQVIESAEYFGRVVWKVLRGETPTAAMAQIKNKGFNRAPYAGWVENGLQSIEMDTRQAIKKFGQMCETAAAFPSVVHLIGKYENNLKEALVENAMAGGDSAGRGLLVGLILGARAGLETIPQNWISNLKAHRKIVDFLDKIDHTGRS